jgi:oligoribonuclease NrnB/cAMP/cGMP phosphodiesterase (DHH superfamily)
MDGWCSAAIVALKTGDYNPDNYIGVDHNKRSLLSLSNRLSKIVNEDIYISDLSFSEKEKHILLNLIKNSNNIIWNDHHDTSIKFEEKFSDELPIIKGIRNKSGSGALNTWKSLFPYTEAPRIVKLVSDWDTFTLNYNESTSLMYGINSINKFKNPLSDAWRQLLENNKSNEFKMHSITDLIIEGNSIKRYLNIQYDEIIKNSAYISEYEGTECLVINHPKATSLIFGEYYKKYPFVVVFSYDGSKYKYSLYSNNKFDVSTIAEKFGGGGHKGAAGFASDKLLFNKKR